MASLYTFAPPSYSIGILRRPSLAICSPFLNRVVPAGLNLNANLNVRFSKELYLQEKKRRGRVSASNTNPEKKADDTKSSDGASSPPFLTILAGLLVFLFISWIIGSVVMWIIGFVLHPPQLK
ncbi:uncharacterized protein LOC125201648 [Salvia hispanica]|uniref:uncharacterized protein LOC125201648 n=1 Tax=Salvia hispanica TaxID=49212 RepID=UPI0020097D90|nr:uncharacterized protein LOC125201648 [Salvia hispanica]